MVAARFRLGALRRERRDTGGGRHGERANRAARLIVDRIDSELGVGPGPSQRRYGDYYATSASVHAAVKIRAEAVSRPPLISLRREEGGGGQRVTGTRASQRATGIHPSQRVTGPRSSQMVTGMLPSDRAPAYEPAGHDDPLQALLDRPNPVWSPGELWRATETDLLLCGSAYWGIERDPARPDRVAEIWPLRPDRVRVLPDRQRYIKGFVYEHGGERVAYLPEEVVWFRHFNPVEEFGGLSAVAPVRLAVDMGAEALRFNRNFFSNSAMPGDLAVTTQETPTDDEVSEFYERWEARFKGAGRAHLPLLLSRGMDVKRLGQSHRDMEFLAGLRWTVDEVSRVFGVPKAFLAQLEDATMANVDAQERFFWRNTVVPELRLMEDALNRSLTPLFDDFPGQRRVQFDLSAIEALQESENDRVDRLVKLVQAGVVSVEEARGRL